MRFYVVSCSEGRIERFLRYAEPLQIDFKVVNGIVPTDDEFKLFEPHFLETHRAADVACTLSHVRAMKLFLETDDDIAAIVEDDVRFHKNFKSMIKILKQVIRGGGIDVLSFGACGDCYGEVEDIGEGMSILRDSRVGNPFGTQGYILTRDYANRFVNAVSSPDVYELLQGAIIADCSIVGPALGCRRISLFIPIAIEDPSEQSIIGNHKHPMLSLTSTDDYYVYS
jgi:GR25 family glycosyltransferase involved in LPS biosynthesis